LKIRTVLHKSEVQNSKTIFLLNLFSIDSPVVNVTASSVTSTAWHWQSMAQWTLFRVRYTAMQHWYSSY